MRKFYGDFLQEIIAPYIYSYVLLLKYLHVYASLGNQRCFLM